VLGPPAAEAARRAKKKAASLVRRYFLVRDSFASWVLLL